jgi:hypothetical protein
LTSDESVYCRAVKVRRDRLEAPGRKEFKVYKDRLELRYENLSMIALPTLASDESVHYRAVKVRQARLEAPVRKEFKESKDRSELR